MRVNKKLRRKPIIGLVFNNGLKKEQLKPIKYFLRKIGRKDIYFEHETPCNRCKYFYVIFFNTHPLGIPRIKLVCVNENNIKSTYCSTIIQCGYLHKPKRSPGQINQDGFCTWFKYNDKVKNIEDIKLTDLQVVDDIDHTEKIKIINEKCLKQ